MAFGRELSPVEDLRLFEPRGAASGIRGKCSVGGNIADVESAPYSSGSARLSCPGRASCRTKVKAQTRRAPNTCLLGPRLCPHRREWAELPLCNACEESAMHKENGRIVETPVEARAGFLDRPVFVVLTVSTSAVIIV